MISPEARPKPLDGSLVYFVLLLSIFFSGFTGVRVSGYANLSDLTLLFLVVLWLSLFPFVKHLKILPSVVLSMLLFGVSFSVTFLTDTSDKGVVADLTVLLKVLIAFYILPYIIADTVRSDKAIRYVILGYVLSAIINVLVSFFDSLHLTNIQQWLSISTVGGWTYEKRFNGLMMHPNQMGQQCAIAIFLMISVFPKTKGYKIKALWAGSFLLLAFGVVGSGSRGSLLAVFLMGLMLFFIYCRRYILQPSKIISIVAMAVFLVALNVYLNMQSDSQGAFTRLFSSGDGVDVSTETRAALYFEALKDFLSNPATGIGFSHVGGVPNVYIQFLQGTGVVGVLAFFVYVMPPLWMSRKLLNPHRYDLLTLGAASAVGVFLLVCVTQNQIYARFILIPMGILWALVRPARRRTCLEIISQH